MIASPSVRILFLSLGVALVILLADLVVALVDPRVKFT